MNTGIADAYDIATRLAAVAAGQADDAMLDAYERQRRAAAHEVLRLTDRLTNLATLKHPIARAARRGAALVISRIAPIRRSIAISAAGLKRSPLRQQLPTITPVRPNASEL